MNSRDFLKPKNFKIKPQSLSFESVKFMTDLEKKKIYINFVKLLNNHFKRTLFKKNLYEHFHLHCGFIAHYDIHGFYGEYFETAASYHFNVNDYSNPMHECGGNLNQKSTLSHGEQFYAIYEEINGTRNGLGEFYDTLGGNMNYGAYSDYSDLDDAIKNAFSEYMEIWRDEIKKAIKAYDEFSKDGRVAELIAQKENIANEQNRLNVSHAQIEEELIKEANASKVETKTVSNDTQLNLFDFVA
ncbi:hypothetical protein [Sulfurimonas sp.]|uniref:hypothetical protein n=1 Tax=Sulfurimonas sp. TaxID=2022749 RepID=UPI0025F0527B|nr:hypothetical protein [Sulfurimonas sp.]